MPRRSDLLVLLLLVAACGPARRVADPIPDIPGNQQRTVTRSELRYDWPFTVGTGTLGCASGAVVFRAAGTSYGLNDAAKARGFSSVDPIHASQGSGPPSDPLKRLNQDQRMEVFRASAACGRDADVAGCRHRLRLARTVSEAELNQIDAEGRERFWPPLEPKRMSLDPVIAAGLKLCSP